MHNISSMQKQANCVLSDNLKMVVSYTGKKSLCFNGKYTAVFNYEHDIVYHAKCPE